MYRLTRASADLVDVNNVNGDNDDDDVIFTAVVWSSLDGLDPFSWKTLIQMRDLATTLCIGLYFIKSFANVAALQFIIVAVYIFSERKRDVLK